VQSQRRAARRSDGTILAAFWKKIKKKLSSRGDLSSHVPMGKEGLGPRSGKEKEGDTRGFIRRGGLGVPSLDLLCSFNRCQGSEAREGKRVRLYDHPGEEGGGGKREAVTVGGCSVGGRRNHHRVSSGEGKF